MHPAQDQPSTQQGACGEAVRLLCCWDAEGKGGGGTRAASDGG